MRTLSQNTSEFRPSDEVKIGFQIETGTKKIKTLKEGIKEEFKICS